MDRLDVENGPFRIYLFCLLNAFSQSFFHIPKQNHAVFYPPLIDVSEGRCLRLLDGAGRCRSYTLSLFFPGLTATVLLQYGTANTYVYQSDQKCKVFLDTFVPTKGPLYF